jgi:hypothetical protein
LEGCDSKVYGFYVLLCDFIFRNISRLWALNGAEDPTRIHARTPLPPFLQLPATIEWKVALTSELVWTLREKNNRILNYLKLKLDLSVLVGKVEWKEWSSTSGR